MSYHLDLGRHRASSSLAPTSCSHRPPRCMASNRAPILDGQISQMARSTSKPRQQTSTTPCPSPRKRVPSARTRPAIRIQVHKQLQSSSLLPSPVLSPVVLPSPPRPATPPLTAPASLTAFPTFATPPRLKKPSALYPTPNTPSPLRPHPRHLGHLQTPSYSSFTSSVASSSRGPTPSIDASSSYASSSRPSHRHASSLTFVPSPVRPSLAMSFTLSQPTGRRPSHSRSTSAEIELPVRPPSRSERLLRETLVRDTRRSRGRRADSYSAPQHLPDMFDCCADDEEDSGSRPAFQRAMSMQTPARTARSPSSSPDAAAERTRAWVEVRGVYAQLLETLN